MLISKHAHTQTYIYACIHTYIYLYVCAWLHALHREKYCEKLQFAANISATAHKTFALNFSVYVFACVCVYVCVCVCLVLRLLTFHYSGLVLRLLVFVDVSADVAADADVVVLFLVWLAVIVVVVCKLCWQLLCLWLAKYFPTLPHSRT